MRFYNTIGIHQSIIDRQSRDRLPFVIPTIINKQRNKNKTRKCGEVIQGKERKKKPAGVSGMTEKMRDPLVGGLRGHHSNHHEKVKEDKTNRKREELAWRKKKEERLSKKEEFCERKPIRARSTRHHGKTASRITKQKKRKSKGKKSGGGGASVLKEEDCGRYFFSFQ